jgi:RNA polymerase sigma factor (sigma-70 family)
MTDVTRILSAIEQGNPHASAELLPLVDDELKELAAQRMAQEKPGQTLQATALVHEAYLRLVASPAPASPVPASPGRESGESAQQWDSRGHFFAAAAEAMRRILVEQARRKKSLKAGGQRERIAISDVDPAIEAPNLDLLALDEALEKLHAKDPRKAGLVKLRFFAGLTNEQAAKALGIATSTADADWAYAKSWLRAEMSEQP